MAVAVTGVTVVAAWFFLKQGNWQNANRPDNKFVVLVRDGQGLGFNLIVLLVGILFYLLAYLPAYLWYLVPAIRICRRLAWRSCWQPCWVR